MSLFEDRGAVFSEDRVYRYTLWRRWSDDPTVVFLMLNPSTADEQKNDPTVERCYRRAKREGWGQIVVLNLFALRSTDPALLYTHPDPVGPENDFYIEQECRAARDVVCAWGTHGAYLSRAKDVAKLVRRVADPLWALGINADGSPKHPLYVPNAQELRRFSL